MNRDMPLPPPHHCQEGTRRPPGVRRL